MSYDLFNLTFPQINGFQLNVNGMTNVIRSNRRVSLLQSDILKFESPPTTKKKKSHIVAVKNCL